MLRQTKLLSESDELLDWTAGAEAFFGVPSQLLVLAKHPSIFITSHYLSLSREMAYRAVQSSPAIIVQHENLRECIEYD